MSVVTVPTSVRVEIDRLRTAIDAENRSLLEHLNRRQVHADAVGELKRAHGLRVADGARESDMLTSLLQSNGGPLGPDAIRGIFGEVFSQSRARLLASREPGTPTERQPAFSVRGHPFGPAPVCIAGPLFVERFDDLALTARALAALGHGFLRGVVERPGSGQSPGEGLRALRRAADEHGLAVVTEVQDPRDVELVATYADILQIGNRNMFRRDLLRAAGASGRPVLIKRGQLATLDDLVTSAREAADAGAREVVLCERGTHTPNGPVVDIAAIPTLRVRTPWPVVLDVSHATADPALLAPLGRAALAAGAVGIMVITHPRPASAQQDGAVQLDLHELQRFHGAVFEAGGRR